MSLVAFDADVLGRQRTGDETYALNLLRALGRLAPDAGIRLVAITRTDGRGRRLLQLEKGFPRRVQDGQCRPRLVGREDPGELGHADRHLNRADRACQTGCLVGPRVPDLACATWHRSG